MKKKQVSYGVVYEGVVHEWYGMVHCEVCVYYVCMCVLY